ncbi:MAG: hypothetical protein PHV51_06980 [Methanosarcinaceae archaeon]|nr:hypothetical protein [Methanosarcinaceae archaeon]
MASINWDISSENPSLGDTLIIRGTAAPNEKLRVEVSFEKEASVSDGEYYYEIEEVKIPEGDNTFTVRAEGVNDLYVRVKKVIWINLKEEATDGVASITQSHVPAWTYKVVIDGEAQSGKSTVDLKITAAQTIEADSEGKFEYSYKTSSMPAGDFKIK